jgi:polyisoprenoid-binding protein YceI
MVSAVLLAISQAQSPSEVPVFEITPISSTIKFDVEASVAIKGTFDKWDATLTFTSADVTTGVLDIKIQADSVDTGSGMKNGKLKGDKFFDTKQNPLITFKSTKIVQTGPDTFEADGDFTIRGVTKPEKLTLTVSGNRDRCCALERRCLLLLRARAKNYGTYFSADCSRHPSSYRIRLAVHRCADHVEWG